MHENQKVYFNKVEKYEEKEIFDSIKERQLKGLEKIPGELEKNQEELKAIEIINELLSKYITSLGLKAKEYLHPDRVHFVDGKTAKKKFSDSSHGAEYNPLHDSILANTESMTEKGRLHLYRVLLHELTHYYSYKADFAIGEKEKIIHYRLGYDLYNVFDDMTHEHFRGFNEAITEKISQEILQTNLVYLKDEFKVTNDEISKSRFRGIYDDYIDLLNMIINKMAEELKVSVDSIWKNFKKGYFSGDMMQLRDIEKVFGPGSLRVLGALYSPGSVKRGSNRKSLDKINEFFAEEDQAKRDILANKILSERERLKYKEHKRFMS
jgi:hypothetical protein